MNCKQLFFLSFIAFSSVFCEINKPRRPVPPISISKEHERSTLGNFNQTHLFQIKDKIFQDLLSRKVEPKKPGYSFLNLNQGSAPTLKGPENLLDYNYQDVLTSLPSYGIADNKPWSGYYWAYRYGLLSARYSSDNKNSMCLISNGQIVQWLTYGQSVYSYSQPQEDYSVKKQATKEVYQNYVNSYYSSAEKIDLLFGDADFSMTNWMKQQGYKYLTDNDVPSWLGICNGWAPASYLEPRVKKAVTLTAYNNSTQIDFLPDDMEAYASLFFAMTNYDIKLVGSRCSDVNDPYCVLMNAGVFAIVIANQIGVRKQNCIFEPKVDSEIWNFPAYSYTFQFYNAKNRKTRSYTYTLTKDLLLTQYDLKTIYNPIITKALKSSTARYTQYYTGLRLCVYYVGEDYPYHDSTSFDDTTGQTCYDMILALATGNKIIDGFWDQADIPTYIWTPINPNTIKGAYDDYVSSFNGTKEDIAKYRQYAINSSKKGTVLRKVMEYFMKQASQ